MAAIKAKEIRGLHAEELEEKVVSLKNELSKEKAQISSGTKAENPGKIKKIRREIARTLTIINEKKLLGKVSTKSKKEDTKEKQDSKKSLAKIKEKNKKGVKK